MTIRKFAVVVDGEVAGTISLDDSNTSDAVQRHIAAFDSDARIIPVTTEDPIEYGWTYDGAAFVPPIQP